MASLDWRSPRPTRRARFCSSKAGSPLSAVVQAFRPAGDGLRADVSVRPTRPSSRIAIRHLHSSNTNVGVAKQAAGDICLCDWRSGPGLALSRRWPSARFGANLSRRVLTFDEWRRRIANGGDILLGVGLVMFWRGDDSGRGKHSGATKSMGCEERARAERAIAIYRLTERSRRGTSVAISCRENSARARVCRRDAH